MARRVNKMVLNTPGVAHTVPFVGLDGATFTNATERSGDFRRASSRSTSAPSRPDRRAQIIGKLFAAIQQIEEAFIIAMPPPPVRGIGTTGGFKLELQDRRRRSRPARGAYAADGSGAARTPGLASVFTTFNTQRRRSVPISTARRPRCSASGPTTCSTTLEVYLGSQYVNDFNFLRPHLPGHGAGRRPVPPGPARHLAAEDAQRQRRDGAARLGRRPSATSPDPIASSTSICSRRPPCKAARLPGYPPATASPPWRRSRRSSCRPATRHRWTELAFQEQLAGNTAIYVFAALGGVRVPACSRRNMKAGRCRSPSFSSCRCACSPR